MSISIEQLRIWSYLFMTVAVFATALGHLLYKMYFIKKQKRYFIGSVLVFCFVPLLNYGALLSLEIGLVYMMTSMTHVLVLGLSVAVLKEYITIRQIVSSLMIVSGIILYGL